MRVGVYIDGLNLYNGAKAWSRQWSERCSNSDVPQWKWLDMRSLSVDLAKTRWPQARIVRVVYCTALVVPRDGETPSARDRQQAYIRALRKSGSVDWVEKGKFYEQAKERPIATADGRGRPVVARPKQWVTVADREEKGTDVNLASHLLIETIEREVDAAIVISNDSDFRLPVREARRRIPVGVVNPSPSERAGARASEPR